MTCPSDQDVVHLAECATCRARVDRYARVAAALPSAYATDADPAFAAKVIAQLEQNAPARPRSALPRVALAVGLCTAAMLSVLTLNVTDERTAELTARGRESAERAATSRELGFELLRDGALVENGAVIKHGDGFTFRVFNRSGKKIELAVFAIDAAREVHWLVPAWTSAEETPPRTQAIAANAAVSILEHGVIPENLATGALVVHALFLDRSLSVVELEAAIEDGDLAFLSAVIETRALEVKP